MDTLTWLIPTLIALFVLGKVAEALRAMRGSLSEDLTLLHASISDVRRKLSSAATGSGKDEANSKVAPLPESARTQISGLLDVAEENWKKFHLTVPAASYGTRLHARRQVKRALRKVNVARQRLRPYLPADTDD